MIQKTNLKKKKNPILPQNPAYNGLFSKNKTFFISVGSVSYTSVYI